MKLMFIILPTLLCISSKRHIIGNEGSSFVKPWSFVTISPMEYKTRELFRHSCLIQRHGVYCGGNYMKIHIIGPTRNYELNDWITKLCPEVNY